KRTRTGSWPLLSYAPWVLQLLSEFAHWLFIAEQDNRYIEVVCILSLASESGEQHIDVFINMFEDPIDDVISRNIETKTFATLYKYIERIPFTPGVKKEFLSSIENINFS
ncbi:hypothetical protein, partial [Klebsiella quasipneumoniae]|uniref:hypothetical protein n=1 Tax=Klebsiella quasipneumoniae TaxID=1463165 RepID=UPI00292B0F82